MAPFNLVVRLTGQPVVSGLGEVDGMPVYVTNGAGFWGPPVRVGAPPDITLVRAYATYQSTDDQGRVAACRRARGREPPAG